MKSQKKHILPCLFLFCLFLCLSLFVSSCVSNQSQPPASFFSFAPDSTSAVETQKEENNPVLLPSPHSPVQLRVHFLDVGQGDSAFLQLPNGKTLLIDAGNPGDGPFIADYIRSLGISHIDYIVATHPHADHIGGMAEIIYKFDIGEIYMPKISHTSKTYETLLHTIRDNGLKIHNGTAGSLLFNHDECRAEILSPDSSVLSADLNDASIVCKISYGKTSFLFTGDISSAIETRLSNPACAVLKVAHHGSDTSSSAAFLKKASPEYAVISVGKNNSYGHPASDTLERLDQAGAEILTTSEWGTIIFESDGVTVDFSATRKTAASYISNPAPSSHSPAAEAPPESMVYITKTGKKYHRSSCSYLKSSKIPIDLSSAKKEGYTPCSRCNPG